MSKAQDWITHRAGGGIIPLAATYAGERARVAREAAIMIIALTYPPVTNHNLLCYPVDVLVCCVRGREFGDAGWPSLI